METVVKFKVLKNDGRKASIKVKYKNCPDFIEEKSIANYIKHPMKDGFVQIQFGEEIVEGSILREEIITTIEDQIDKWVETFDKTGWMDDHDVAIIFNWEVLSYSGMAQNAETGETGLAIVQTKNNLVSKLSPIENMKMFFEVNKESISQDVIDNYIVVYSEMADSMKNMSWEKQMAITFKAMGIASTAASTAYDNIMGYSAALKKVNWDKHRYTKASDINKYGNWNMDAIRREAKMIQNGHELDSNLIIPENTKS